MYYHIAILVWRDRIQDSFEQGLWNYQQTFIQSL